MTTKSTWTIERPTTPGFYWVRWQVRGIINSKEFLQTPCVKLVEVENYGGKAMYWIANSPIALQSVSFVTHWMVAEIPKLPEDS